MFPFFLIFGLIMCFAGKAYLAQLIFISGVVEATALIILIVYSTFAKNSEEIWVGYVVLACSLSIGLLFGFILFKF